MKDGSEALHHHHICLHGGGFEGKCVNPAWSQCVYQTWNDAAWTWTTFFHLSWAWKPRNRQEETLGSSCLYCAPDAPVFLPLNCTGGLSAHKHVYVVVLKSSTGPLRAPLSFFYNWPNLPVAVFAAPSAVRDRPLLFSYEGYICLLLLASTTLEALMSFLSSVIKSEAWVRPERHRTQTLIYKTHASSEKWTTKGIYSPVKHL